MPPECLLGLKYNKSADVYALGVTMYETMAGALPFDGRASF